MVGRKGEDDEGKSHLCQMRLNSPSMDHPWGPWLPFGKIPEDPGLPKKNHFDQKEHSYAPLPKEFLQTHTIRNTDLSLHTVSFYLTSYLKILSPNLS